MASPVDTSVKLFRDDFPGASSLGNAAGDLNGVLHACLVTGFGTRTATSLVVSGGVATVTLPSDAKNPNMLYSVIEVAGVTGGMTALNGEQRVNGATSTTLTFATAVGDGAASGTITIKTAPAGWTRPYTGTNKAVFKSASPESTGMLLRVDDIAAINAYVRGFEAMTDVDTGSGPFPATARSTDGGRWFKGYAAGAKWDLVADSRALIYSPIPYSTGSPTYIGQTSYFFGDFLPHKSTDAFACALFAGAADVASNTLLYGSVLYGSQGSTGGIASYPRSHTGLGAELAAFACPASGSSTAVSGSDNWFGAYPTAADSKPRMARMQLTETSALGNSSTILRGYLPGIYYSPQTGLNTQFQRGDTILLNGRRLYVVSANSSVSETSSSGGRGFIDITGPWR